ncbi:unnamed protein product, partial [Amoebophrya sp. A25]
QANARNQGEERKNNYLINLVQFTYEYEHGRIGSEETMAAFLSLEQHFRQPVKIAERDNFGMRSGAKHLDDRSPRGGRARGSRGGAWGGGAG